MILGLRRNDTLALQEGPDPLSPEEIYDHQAGVHASENACQRAPLHPSYGRSDVRYCWGNLCCIHDVILPKHHGCLLLVDGDGAYYTTCIRVELRGDLHRLGWRLTAGHGCHGELASRSDSERLAYLVRDHLVRFQAVNLGLSNQ